MPSIQLPNTPHCLVCGKSNQHGLALQLFVDEESGRVTVDVTTESWQVGFDGIIHGGIIATIIDEAMVWAATWKVRRFCLCGELTTRFRNTIAPGQILKISAEVEFFRPKLVEVAAKVFDAEGALLATGSGKYVPVTTQQHSTMIKAFNEEPATASALNVLRVPR